MSQPAATPLDVFVHIPKTAGSALNFMLLRHFAGRRAPRAWALAERAVPEVVLTNPVTLRRLSRSLAEGCPYLGVYLSRPELFDRTLATARWVSGHIPAAGFARHLGRVGRAGQFHTVLRDPVEQVASHYQWWIEIHARGPWRYLRYGDGPKALSRRIRATDNADPRAVAAILADHPGFLNMQSRFIVGRKGGGPEAALRRLASFGLDHDLAPVVRAITGEEPPAVARVNRSRSRLDRSVFREPYLADFLRERNGLDAELYAAALDLRAERG